jgi:hypothetical protein
MQNEAGDSFFLERAHFLAENGISRPSIHQNLFCLAGKLDLDESIPYSQTCGYHSSPPDMCQFCSKIVNFFHGGSGGAM